MYVSVWKYSVKCISVKSVECMKVYERVYNNFILYSTFEKWTYLCWTVLNMKGSYISSRCNEYQAGCRCEVNKTDEDHNFQWILEKSGSSMMCVYDVKPNPQLHNLMETADPVKSLKL